MERCYEYFDCNQEDCPAHRAPDSKQCWEVDGTLCISHGIDRLASVLGGKVYACEKCVYFKEATTKHNH